MSFLGSSLQVLRAKPGSTSLEFRQVLFRVRKIRCVVICSGVHLQNRQRGSAGRRCGESNETRLNADFGQLFHFSMGTQAFPFINWR